jgi:hypothetical protein
VLKRRQIKILESLDGWDEFVDKSPKKLDEWVKIAEQLAKDHDGILPSYIWLKKNGFHGINDAQCRRPELFEHLDQEKMVKTPIEWVMIAEEIANDNGGVLPCSKELSQRGMHALAKLLSDKPELFSHIRREMLHMSLAVRIEEAEKLAIKNDGALPACSWLLDNGYRSLYAAMLKTPSAFFHLDKTKKVKNADDWVLLAKRLSKNGKLPSYSVLKNNPEYSGLPDMINRYPEKFSDFVMENELGKKTKEEWVVEAKKLVKKFGHIPPPGWLLKNSYSGLCQCMYNNKILFANLPQAKRRGGGRKKRIMDKSLTHKEN